MTVYRHREKKARGHHVSGVAAGRVYLVDSDGLLRLVVGSAALSEAGVHPDDAVEFEQFPGVFERIGPPAAPPPPPPKVANVAPAKAISGGRDIKPPPPPPPVRQGTFAALLPDPKKGHNALTTAGWVDLAAQAGVVVDPPVVGVESKAEWVASLRSRLEVMDIPAVAAPPPEDPEEDPEDPEDPEEDPEANPEDPEDNKDPTSAGDPA